MIQYTRSFHKGRIIGKRGHRPRVGGEKKFPPPSLFAVRTMAKEDRTLSVFVDESGTHSHGNLKFAIIHAMHPLYRKADSLIAEVISAAVAVHEHFGPGLMESIYVKCLEHALRAKGISTAREVCVPIRYMSMTFDEHLRMDLLVDDCLVVEAKAVEKPNPMLFRMQTLTYMKLTNLPLGLVLNFGGTTMRNRNIWRVILKGADAPDSSEDF